MPFRGMMEKLAQFSVVATDGSIRWHRLFFEFYKSYNLHALLTVIAVLTQSVYVLLHRDWKDPLWRWGAVGVAYFSCISYLSWESHFTVTRHALIVTLVFNLLLAMRPTRFWLIWFLLGNCFVPFGVRYFDQMRFAHSPPAPIEFVTEAPPEAKSVIQAKYVEGWSAQQWDGVRTWRWANGPTASLGFYNESSRTVRAEVRFLARSREVRKVFIKYGEKIVYEGELQAKRTVVEFPLELRPGSSRIIFSATGTMNDADDDTSGQVMFRIENPHLRMMP